MQGSYLPPLGKEFPGVFGPAVVVGYCYYVRVMHSNFGNTVDTFVDPAAVL